MQYKLITLIVVTGFLLTACGNSEGSNSPVNYDPNAMPSMPCHMMGETYMGDCEFDEKGNVIIDDSMEHGMMNNDSETFSTKTDGLPEAQPSKVVELKDGDTYQMTASIVKQEVGNRTIKRLAYNGQIPGPLLSVPKDATITVEFKNELDVDTTIHSHGLRLDNEFDGVPDVTQDPIKPGENFTYQLKFPDEGIYWYHPHIREDYTQELGLYGNYLVTPDDESYWNKVNREEFLILDDLLLSPSEPRFPTDYTNKILMGRFGNVMLINNEENYELTAKKNEVIRLYINNVANTRHFNFQIPGAKMKLVGGDVGRIEKEEFIDSFIIAPAERYIVEVVFEEERSYNIENKTPAKTYAFGSVMVSGEVDENLTSLFNQLRDSSADFESLRSDVENLMAKTPDKSIRLSVDMPGMDMSMMEMGSMMSDDSMEHGMHADNDIEWEDDMPAMNNVSTSEDTFWKIIDEEAGNENMDIDWQFKQGDLVKIRIFNDPESMHPMQHPIHFHGQRFLVLSRDGELNNNFQWKDTALIKNGETVDILVEMSNPGTWMSHCHIAEHLHSGMMFSFDVI